MKRLQAFSLIELLVVLGIISILLGMLLPALSKARLAAQKLVETSDHHHLAIAIQAYAADQNGYAPIKGGMELSPEGGQRFYGPAPGVHNAGSLAGATVAGAISTPTGGYNVTVGLGVLMPKGKRADASPSMRFGDYVAIEKMYAPKDRRPRIQWANQWGSLDGIGYVPFTSIGEDFPSFWVRREWFGDQSREDWGSYAGGDGEPWWAWTPRNEHFRTSYAYRGADYSWVSPDDPTQCLSFQASPSGGFTDEWSLFFDADLSSANLKRAHTEHRDFVDNGITMTYVAADERESLFVDPRNPGVHVGIGDGSVIYAEDPEFIIESFDTADGVAAPVLKGWWADQWWNTLSRRFASFDQAYDR